LIEYGYFKIIIDSSVGLIKAKLPYKGVQGIILELEVFKILDKVLVFSGVQSLY